MRQATDIRRLRRSGTVVTEREIKLVAIINYAAVFMENAAKDLRLVMGSADATRRLMRGAKAVRSDLRSVL
jgi:hypothetical protein